MKKLNVIALINAGVLLATCTLTNLVRAEDSDSDSDSGNHNIILPAVQIVSPDDGQYFLVKTPIHICEVSWGFTDALAQVEFQAGTNVLGVVTNGLNAAVWEGDDHPVAESFACITWSNAPAGSYTLQVTATDLAGTSVTSPPVAISVVTSLPPHVRIVQPENNALILGPTNVMICASAYDPDGRVADVTFYNGTNAIGIVSNSPPVWVTNSHCVFPLRQSEYCMIWSNVGPGSYTLTAAATDTNGTRAVSAPVDISVVTNLPPIVRILEPDHDEAFYAPAKIVIYAGARDPDGSVANVQFFAGSQSLGTVTNGYTITNECGVVQTVYSVTWSNGAAGKYSLDAVATDNEGLMSTSGPVHITILPPPPPSVRIVYPDNHDRFYAPAKVPISATTRFFTNPIAYVKFLSGNTTLGVVSNQWSPTFYWTNVPAGSYGLKVIAADTNGITATSPVINITVAKPPPGKAVGHNK